MTPTESVGTRLYQIGFRATAWYAQTATGPGIVRGNFDPTETDPVKRYGSPSGLAVMGWPPDQYTGPHASGLNSRAIELATAVLGVPASGNDLADLDFVSGATPYILQQASALGLLVPEPGAPPVTPPGDPCADVKKQLAATVELLNADQGVFAAIARATATAKKALPAGAGGGQYAAALRAYVKAVEAAQGLVKA